MKLVHLKMEPDEESHSLMPAMPMEPMYPMGCCLCLSEDELEALGFEELPPAGTEFRIEAMGMVVSSGTEDPDADGDIDSAHVRIQVTHLGLEGDTDEERTERKKTKAAKLYGKGVADKDGGGTTGPYGKLNKPVGG